MKQLTIIALLSILSIFNTSCEQSNTTVSQQPLSVVEQPVIEYTTVVTIKIIKDLKEVQEQNTTYEEKLNVSSSLWNGDLKTSVVPNIHTKTTYYIIYTDHTNEEVGRDTWLNYSKGDSIKKYQKVPISI